MARPERERAQGAGTPDALARAYDHARAFLAGLETRPVAARSSPGALRELLGGPLPEAGTAPAEVVDDLVAATDGGHLGSASGRFFAWVIGGSLEAALAADWLCSTWDQNAALHPCSPSGSVVEEIAGAWLLELLDLPRGASFAFTTGCQLAHFTALAAARDAVLHRRGWDVSKDGLHGAPAVRILTGEERHGSVDRALRFLGFGEKQVVRVATDREGRVDADALETSLGGADGPSIVILTAADLNIAAFDDFERIVPMARAAGAWVHVDGAFGLFARASPEHRHRTAGVEGADSWATDCHKWLNVPFDSGFACVRDGAAHRRAMSIGAAYITTDGTARDQIDWNPEWSRRARGFAVYAALRQLGRAGIAGLVERCCAHARAIVDGMGRLSRAEVVWRPTLNQGLVRFRDPREGAGEEDHARATEAIQRAVNASGEAFFSLTTWRGLRCLRVSVVNWRTGEDEVRRAVGAVAAAIDSLAPR